MSDQEQERVVRRSNRLREKALGGNLVTTALQHHIIHGDAAGGLKQQAGGQVEPAMSDPAMLATTTSAFASLTLEVGPTHPTALAASLTHTGAVEHERAKGTNLERQVRPILIEGSNSGAAQPQAAAKPAQTTNTAGQHSTAAGNTLAPAAGQDGAVAQPTAAAPTIVNNGAAAKPSASAPASTLIRSAQQHSTAAGATSTLAASQGMASASSSPPEAQAALGPSEPSGAAAKPSTSAPASIIIRSAQQHSTAAGAISTLAASQGMASASSSPPEAQAALGPSEPSGAAAKPSASAPASTLIRSAQQHSTAAGAISTLAASQGMASASSSPPEAQAALGPSEPSGAAAKPSASAPASTLIRSAWQHHSAAGAVGPLAPSQAMASAYSSPSEARATDTHCTAAADPTAEQGQIRGEVNQNARSSEQAHQQGAEACTSLQQVRMDHTEGVNTDSDEDEFHTPERGSPPIVFKVVGDTSASTPRLRRSASDPYLTANERIRQDVRPIGPALVVSSSNVAGALLLAANEHTNLSVVPPVLALGAGGSSKSCNTSAAIIAPAVLIAPNIATVAHAAPNACKSGCPTGMRPLMVGMLTAAQYKDYRQYTPAAGSGLEIKDGSATPVDSFFMAATMHISETTEERQMPLEQWAFDVGMRVVAGQQAHTLFKAQQAAIIAAVIAELPDATVAGRKPRNMLFLVKMREAMDKLLNRSVHDKEKQLKAFTHIQANSTQAYHYPDAMLAEIVRLWKACKEHVPEHEAVSIACWCLNMLQPRWMHSVLGEQKALGKIAYKAICENKEPKTWKLQELCEVVQKAYTDKQDNMRNSTLSEEQSKMPPSAPPPHPFGAWPPVAQRSGRSSSPNYFVRRGDRLASVHTAQLDESGCEVCGHPRHIAADCWRTNPKKHPEGLNWAGPKDEEGYGIWAEACLAIGHSKPAWDKRPPQYRSPTVGGRGRGRGTSAPPPPPSVTRPNNQPPPPPDRNNDRASRGRSAGSGGRSWGRAGDRGGRGNGSAMSIHAPYTPPYSPHQPSGWQPPYPSQGGLTNQQQAREIDHLRYELARSEWARRQADDRAATSVASSAIGPSASRSGWQGATQPTHIQPPGPTSFSVQLAREHHIMSHGEHQAMAARNPLSFQQEPLRLAEGEAEIASYIPTQDPTGQRKRAVPSAPVTRASAKRVSFMDMHVTAGEPLDMEQLLETLATKQQECVETLGKIRTLQGRKSPQKVAAITKRRVPATHLRGKSFKAAFATNDSAQTGISLVGPNGQLHTPQHAIMVDSGSDINACTEQEAARLGIPLTPIRTELIAFGDNRCNITKMAQAVPVILLANTPHEVAMEVDCFVMPDNEQYQYLLGQPWLAAPQLSAYSDTYWSELKVRPDLGYMEKEEAARQGEGRVLTIPLNMHGQLEGGQARLVTPVEVVPPHSPPPPMLHGLYVGMTLLSPAGGGEPEGAGAGQQDHQPNRLPIGQGLQLTSAQQAAADRCRPHRGSAMATTTHSSMLLLRQGQVRFVEPTELEESRDRAAATGLMSNGHQAITIMSSDGEELSPSDPDTTSSQVTTSSDEWPGCSPKQALLAIIEGIEGDRQLIEDMSEEQAVWAYNWIAATLRRAPALWQLQPEVQPLPHSLRDERALTGWESLVKGRRQEALRAAIQAEGLPGTVGEYEHVIQVILQALSHVNALRDMMLILDAQPKGPPPPPPPPGAGAAGLAGAATARGAGGQPSAAAAEGQEHHQDQGTTTQHRVRQLGLLVDTLVSSWGLDKPQPSWGQPKEVVWWQQPALDTWAIIATTQMAEPVVCMDAMQDIVEEEQDPNGPPGWEAPSSGHGTWHAQYMWSPEDVLQQSPQWQQQQPPLPQRPRHEFVPRATNQLVTYELCWRVACQYAGWPDGQRWIMQEASLLELMHMDTVLDRGDHSSTDEDTDAYRLRTLPTPPGDIRDVVGVQGYLLMLNGVRHEAMRYLREHTGDNGELPRGWLELYDRIITPSERAHANTTRLFEALHPRSQRHHLTQPPEMWQPPADGDMRGNIRGYDPRSATPATATATQGADNSGGGVATVQPAHMTVPPPLEQQPVRQPRGRVDRGQSGSDRPYRAHRFEWEFEPLPEATNTAEVHHHHHHYHESSSNPTPQQEVPVLFGRADDKHLRGRLYDELYQRAYEEQERELQAELEYSVWLPMHKAIKRGQRIIRAREVSHAQLNKRMRAKGPRPTAKWAKVHKPAAAPKVARPNNTRVAAPWRIGPVWIIIWAITLLMAYSKPVQAMKMHGPVPIEWSVRLGGDQQVTPVQFTTASKQGGMCYRLTTPVGIGGCPTPIDGIPEGGGRRYSSPPPPFNRDLAVGMTILEDSMDSYDVNDTVSISGGMPINFMGPLGSIIGRPERAPALHVNAVGFTGPTVATEVSSSKRLSSLLPDGVTITPHGDRFEEDKELLIQFGKPLLTDPKVKQAYRQMCIDMRDAFAYSIQEVTGYHGICGPLKLLTNTDKTVFCRPRHAGIIEPAPTAVYASAPTLPPKKAPDGTWSDQRFCIDVRSINNILQPMHTPVPVADELFQQLGESSVFTKLDLRSGFYQLPLAEESKQLTAFWWGSALYQFTRAPFGIKTCPAAFQQMMDTELQAAGLSGCTKVFMDDILVHSSSVEEHLGQVRAVLETLKKCGLRAHPEKTLVCSDTMDFLGFDVSKHGLTPSEAKVKAFTDMPHPNNVAELRTVLGQLRYYGCFCPNFSAIARPMLDLLKNDTEWQWRKDGPEGKSLEEVKRIITEPGKALQRFRPDRQTMVHCDFSNIGIGAVLSQIGDDGNEYMVACASRSLNKHERNYSSYKGECMCAVWACKIFKHYLHGNHFTLLTDHQPLAWLMTSNTLEGAHARWACILQEYEFTIKHRPGTENANADALSRLPLASTRDNTGARLDHDPSDHKAMRVYRAQSDDQPHHGMVIKGGTADPMGVYKTAQLDTQPNRPAVLRALQEGVTLFEPFGGLCAGLEAVLRMGITVRRYMYSDNAGAAQAVAQHRIAKLLERYPLLLTPVAVARTFDTLPMDVHQIDTTALVKAGAQDGAQWVVIAGPPCQDFSPAGCSRGLRGERAPTFEHCIQIVGALQQLQQQHPPLFMIENAAMQHNWKNTIIREEDFPAICTAIGTPITVDAAQFGSYAHRVRNFWQNFASVPQVVANISQVRRPTGIIVDNILDKGRYSTTVGRLDTFPQYPANKPGAARSALPTLVAYPQSRAFKVHKSNIITNNTGVVMPGCVYDTQTGRWGEPNPDERERALGYITGDTAAPGVTQQQRHIITGNAMDAWGLAGLLHSCISTSINDELPGFTQLPIVHTIQVTTQPITPTVSPTLLGSEVAKVCSVTVMTACEGGDAGASAPTITDPHALYQTNKVLARKAREPGEVDIHSDIHVLHHLRHQHLRPEVKTPVQIRRVTRRSQSYNIQIGPGGQEQVLRKMANGSTRVVPKMSERKGVIWDAHELSGHFGIRRTMYLLMQSYWWTGMQADVTCIINQCEVCLRTKAAFNAKGAVLNSLPIQGLFYRWGVDLCGPFPKTSRGHKFVLIAIDHFSKTMVLEPLPDKEAKHVCYAFEHGVLGRFGAPAEVVTDQGTEFQGEFAAMLARCFIDHRTTSPNHPQANGAAERCVQTVKRSLRRYCEDSMTANTWDQQLPYISMGYNCSKQMSTNCSPFQLLYAREPAFPTQAKDRFAVEIKMDNQAAAKDILDRAAYLREVMPTIANNLAIAQHRDQLRYATTRDGNYLPKLRRLQAGDYVWVRNNNPNNTLQIKARQVIYRVVEMLQRDMVRVQGKCGTIINVHGSQCARCHLPYIDGVVNPELAHPPKTTGCEECRFTNDEALMLCCDGCGRAWHTFCLRPPLDEVPAGKWVCPLCDEQGITLDMVNARGQIDKPQHQLEKAAVLFPNKETRGRDNAAAAMDGYRVCKPSQDQRALDAWGHLRYRGEKSRPNYFIIEYDNGTLSTPFGMKLARSLQQEAAPGAAEAVTVARRKGRPRKNPLAKQ